MNKENVCFILVRTKFAFNLGLAVRAMKNMGFEKLILVQPECEVGVEARSRAMRGAEILDRAALYPSLAAAAAEVGLLVGTSGRFGEGKKNVTSCRDLAEEVLPRYQTSSVGIAFGSEENGLNREEIKLCQWLVEIPTGSAYSSLNLAQAVIVVAYELHLASMAAADPKSQPALLHLADAEQVRGLIEHVRQSLESVELPPKISVTRLMKRLSRILGRAQLEQEDVNLLHGLLSELDKSGTRPE
ncbi:MAG: RNA methyltransferase [Acidobacteriota bacterium]